MWKFGKVQNSVYRNFFFAKFCSYFVVLDETNKFGNQVELAKTGRYGINPKKPHFDPFWTSRTQTVGPLSAILKIFQFLPQWLPITHIWSKDEPVSSESSISVDTFQILQKFAHFDDPLRVRFSSDRLENGNITFRPPHLRPVRKDPKSVKKIDFLKSLPTVTSQKIRSCPTGSKMVQSTSKSTCRLILRSQWTPPKKSGIGWKLPVLVNRFLKSDNFWTMGPFDPKFGITLFFEVYFHPWEFRKKNFFRLLDRFWNRLTIEPRDWFCSKKFFGHFKVCTNTPPIPKSPHPIVYGAFWFENVLI